MKMAFRLLIICILLSAELTLNSNYAICNDVKGYLVLEASLDKRVLFAVITAGILGVISIRKHPKP